MKSFCYDEWSKKRSKKIISILGKNWFRRKSILELGSCYGDIGIELLKLGSNVTFSDVREENLSEIRNKLLTVGFEPTIENINQNNFYNLNKKFDLVLHLGVLYHIENWQQDLKCALSHTNMMILESSVYPEVKELEYNFSHPKYGAYGCKEPYLTQESIEEELKNLGCKFIRFDDPSLNCDWNWIHNSTGMLRNIYDWNHDDYFKGLYNDPGNDMMYITSFRRMWLILN